jgi:hypothetical protein
VHNCDVAIVAYSYYPKNLSRMESVIDGLTRDVHGALIVNICSANVKNTLKISSRNQLVQLPHEGSGWEFSAYQQGLSHLRSLGWKRSVLFLNDTAGVNYPLTLHMMQSLMEVAALSDSAPSSLSGCLECPPKPNFAYRDIPLEAWIRSNIFVLTAAALKDLNWKLYEEQDFRASKIIHENLILPEFISEALSNHIYEWLTAQGKGGWKHHVKREEIPADILAGKAGSILLEKRLSALVVASGGSLRHCALSSSALLGAAILKFFFWRRRAEALLDGAGRR